MILVCVDPLHAGEIWPFVRQWIWDAMRRGNLSSFAPIERDVLNGNALLWAAMDNQRIHAAAVTQLQWTEWGKSCLIVACGGKGMRQWLPLIEGIERYAWAEGAKTMRIIGRKGWVRMLKDYKVTRVILEKEAR